MSRLPKHNFKKSVCLHPELRYSRKLVWPTLITSRYPELRYSRKSMLLMSRPGNRKEWPTLITNPSKSVCLHPELRYTTVDRLAKFENEAISSY